MNKSVIEKFLQYMLIVRGYPRNTVLAYQNDLEQLEAFCSLEGGDVEDDWWKRLNTTKIEDALNIKIKSWKESLEIFFHINQCKF